MSSNYIKQTLLQKEVNESRAKEVVEETIAPAGADEEASSKKAQVLVRVSEGQRDCWQAAAEADGMSVSEWLRQMADNRYREIFECTHPLDQRKVYPWSEFCLKCGIRLRGSES